ncbi:hypothetical protein HEP87_60660 [Streptomyces sp. S1D4-11]|nr:hypothetical protein [Streptomyces sp. S1D4-11]
MEEMQGPGAEQYGRLAAVLGKGHEVHGAAAILVDVDDSPRST